MVAEAWPVSLVDSSMTGDMAMSLSVMTPSEVMLEMALDTDVALPCESRMGVTPIVKFLWNVDGNMSVAPVTFFYEVVIAP